MTWHTQPESERWVELMAGHTLDDLSQDERIELNALRLERGGDEDLSFDLAATAVHLAMMPQPTAPMPAHLEERILQSFQRFRPIPSPTTPAPPQRVEVPAATAAPSAPMIYRLGWLAAAACFVFAIASWWPRSVPPSNLFVAVDNQADLITPAWTFNEAGGADPRFASVSGEVHWSTAAQSGYMQFAGMPVNDPAIQQYQLWIVDPGRDAEPVDGGVFDVTETGRIRVPIRAKLPIGSPAAFAVTVEKPGGVVVSEGPLHLIAPVKS